MLHSSNYFVFALARQTEEWFIEEPLIYALSTLSEESDRTIKSEEGKFFMFLNVFVFTIPSLYVTLYGTHS